MKALTQSEIFEELMKLGITSEADLKVYCKEYTIYFSHEYLKLPV